MTSTVDRCPRCGGSRISFGGGPMACCAGCGLVADEDVFEASIEEIVTDENVADFADTARAGGSNYWCDELFRLQPRGALRRTSVRSWRPALVRGGGVRRRSAPARLASARRRSDALRHRQNFGQPVDVLHEQLDAREADVAFQYAMLGEIIYGWTDRTISDLRGGQPSWARTTAHSVGDAG